MPTCRGRGSGDCNCRGECAAALTTLRAAECRQESSPLDGLCRDLWPVVYRTMRRRGGSLDEAADLTQAFFLQVIESRSFARARLASGCFRPYLVAAVRNFLRNERVREHAVKRGGHLVLGGFDESHAPVCASLTSPDPGDPDALLDRARFEDAWRAALDRALADARDTAERRRIELLLPHLDGLDRAAECARLADDLGMTPGAVRVALHRLRRKVGGYLTSAARHGA